LRRKRLGGGAEAETATVFDPDLVRPASREETLPIAMGALAAVFVALIVCLGKSWTLLYGDAVAHLGIARRILDSREPGWSQLGGVWLPLPHLIMLPFVQKIEWWQNGMAGTWPSMIFYLLAVVGFYRLSRRMLAPRWAVAATAFFGLNPNVLYLSTTAMTEPMFLALMIWMVLAAVECTAAMAGAAAIQRAGVTRAAEMRTVRRRLWLAGLLIAAAVYTRYDGWVLGAAVWCLLTWQLWRRGLLNEAGWAFRGFTVLSVAAPLGWLWYNAHFFHDPLDFMRGPYSAAAILKRTTPAGAKPYRGWHDPWWAARIYLRTTQVDEAAWLLGFGVTYAAVAGLVLAWRKKLTGAAWLLWIPLPFYVYSIAYGAVPIFNPIIMPGSYYNTRYGVEMIPAMALFVFVTVAAAAAWLCTKGKGGQLAAKLAQPLALLLIALNVVAMMHATPLVLKEAQVNASTRVPFEQALAQVLLELPAGSTVLMSGSDHIGALQRAGIPLARTINEGDYYEWQAALRDPARSAAYVIAMEGDPVAQAVKAHPEGLTEISIFHSSGQPTARVYQSTSYRSK
jgi:hypothetical protein